VVTESGNHRVLVAKVSSTFGVHSPSATGQKQA
jgi:hypothetical protein